jgi:hypothetical protein
MTPAADSLMQTLSWRESLRFRFFDVETPLVSDSPGYFDLFAQTYARFRVGNEGPPAADAVEVTVLTGSDNGAQRAPQRPVLLLGGAMWPLHDPMGLRDHLFERIFALIAARIQSHILVHAAVAERNGRAILIAGDSHHGKTSLALGLLRRGFRLLSDELAAIDRTDGSVHPFPRALRAWPRSLALAGYSVAPDEFPLWLGKVLVDIERLQAGGIGERAPISDIVVLSDPAGPGATPPDFVRVTVDRLEDSWLAALCQLDGVDALHVDRSGSYPAVQIQTEHKVAVLTAVQALCDEQRILCLEMQKRTPHRPDFSHPAQVTSLSKSLAVLELLRHFQGAQDSVILQQAHRGSATSFFVELAGLVQNARCHRLFVGPYEQMLALIDDLMAD